MLKRSNSVELFTKKVMDYMTDDFVLVKRTELIKTAIEKLREFKKSTILVEENNQICGIITEKDILKRVAFSANEQTTVNQVMSQSVKFVYDDDLLFHAVGKMRKLNLNHLPVFDLNLKVLGMIDMNRALTAEIGDIVFQIDHMTYDEQDVSGLIRIKQQQINLAQNLINRNVNTGDISYLLSFLNNVIYRRAIRLAEKRVKEKNIIKEIPNFSVIVMGSGGRMESFLHPDQDNGLIYETNVNEDPKKIDLYFEELAKDFTKTLDDCDIPFCKGDLMASNPLWRKSLPDWKIQIEQWLDKHAPQDMRYIDMLYDFRSVYGKIELAEELRSFVNDKLQEKKLLKFLYFSEEQSDAAIGFFGQFILEKNDEENKGYLNLKHTGTLPLVESIRLYSIKNKITKISTFERLEELNKLKVLTDDETDFFKNAHRFMSKILLINQVERAQQGLEIKNFINPKKLLDREVKLLKIYLKTIKDLKKRVRVDIGEEYF
jgi:CBS domain-containing protein